MVKRHALTTFDDLLGDELSAAQALTWSCDQPAVLCGHTPQPSDEDELGHVNNVIYLHWMEALAWHHSAQLGLKLEDFQRLNSAMVARRHEIDYLNACGSGERLWCATWLAPGGSRLRITRHYEIRHAATGRLVFQAQTDWVCVAIDTGRPKRMPPEFESVYRV